MRLAKKIWNKEVRISELEEVYALIETSYTALKHHKLAETALIERVLHCSYDKIYEIQEKEQKQLKKMKEKQRKSVQS